MAQAASATARRERRAAWQPLLAAFVLLAIALVHLHASDAGFREAFPHNPIVAVVRGLLRIPLVYARLYADHRPAIPVLAAALALVSLAWWASIGAFRERLTHVVEWAGVIFATVRLPLYSRTSVEDRTPNQRTERYFANAETLVAPHAVLLSLMGIREFYLLHVLLLAAAGATGLVALRRETVLAPFAWTLFLIVLFLNGHVTTRLREGSTPWINLWLLPWVLWSLIRLRKGDDGARNCAGLSLCLGVMLMNGAWHVFFWSLMLTALTAIGPRPPFRFLVRLALLVVSIGSLRLVPAVLTFGGGDNDFVGGFNSASDLLMSLIGEGVSGERDYFISWLGVALLAIGLVPLVPATASGVEMLRWPSVAFFVLAMGNLYGATLFHLPAFVSQRVAMRFAIVGALGLLLIGLRQVQQWPAWRESRPTILTWAALAAGLTLAGQLVLSAELARPPAALVAPPAFDNLKTDLFEPAYVWSVRLGLIVSTIAAVYAARATWTAGDASARRLASAAAPKSPR